MRLLTTATIAVNASLLLASMAQGQVSSPLLGYLPDGGQIRPVNGIPAAAAIAPALDLKQDFARIAVSPGRDYVLVSATKVGTVSVYTAGGGLTPLKGAGTAPDLVVTSPRGSAAVLWFSATNHAQLVTGLPGAPAIRQINAPFLRTQPSSLAISDDGNWLAGTWSANNMTSVTERVVRSPNAPTGLYVWGPYGQVSHLPVDENVNAVAFFQGSSDLAVATPRHVLIFKGADGYNAASTLYDSGDSALDAAALAISPDNARVILADRTGWIISLDITSGKSVKVDCGCQPEGLFGMGQSAFRLTGIANGAFRLFDAMHNEVLFAPLALGQGGQQ